MTVATTTNEVTANGDNSTVDFAYANYLAQDSDLVVVLIDSNGNRTTQTLNTDYTIAGTKTNTVYQNGVTVTMVTAPATGEQLEIYNDPSLTQSADYTSNDTFPAETHEQALDKLTILCQRLSQRVTDADIGKQWYKKSDVDLTNGGANDTSEWEWTALPSTTTMIKIVCHTVSTTGTSDYVYIQLGDSGGYETSSYNTLVSLVGPLSTTADTSFTSGFPVEASITNPVLLGVDINLTRMDIGTGDYSWIFSSSAKEQTSPTGTVLSNGQKALSDTLTKVKIVSSTGNFDFGDATLYYYA